MQNSTPTVDLGVLRFMTCGSVDDGKSTLIGRLLYDTRTILSDTLQAMTKTSERRGLSAVDLSLLTDGLQAERQQGITIDVAYRYFSTGTRKYIIADTPGHEQYTRNMVTAASTAQLAIIMIDARTGVASQTRRHTYITQQIGLQRWVVAINKMDLVEYNQACFEQIRQDFLSFSAQIGLPSEAIQFIPMSALNGDMIVDRGEQLAWYDGPTLIHVLENAVIETPEQQADFRFPVQFVCRPQASHSAELHDYRGFMGRVTSGQIKVGDTITALPSGQTSRVQTIQLGEQIQDAACTGQSVTLLLENDIDISRGDMIVKSNQTPMISRQLTAMVCWLAETPLALQRKYIVRHGTRETRAQIKSIDHCLNINTLEHLPATTLAMNDMAQINLMLQQPLFVDRYADSRSGGAFILIDESTYDTVGAGMILSANA